jgi:oligopeptide transport system substrate-binding protein
MTARSRRILLSLGAILAVSAIAVACADAENGEDRPDDPGGAPSGTITIAATQFESWDPHYSSFGQDVAHFVYVWRGLYHLDLNDQPQPAMADGPPQVSADGKTYTIRLKRDLKWSDGQPLTAEDFVLGIQRTCNPDNAGHYQYILSNIVGCDDYYQAADKSAAEKEALRQKVGVRAVDPLTLEIRLQRAQPTFPILLALWPTFPAPKHLLASVDAPWPGPLENVYNGPFMPAAYTERARLELVPNPHWVGTPVGVERVVLKYVDDPAVANNAYRTGEVDATIANKPELDKLKTEFANELHLYPATRTIGLMFNVAKAPVDKAGVRLALSQATDRETMMRVVFRDAHTPTTNWVPPARNGLEGGEFDAILGFNVTKAREHLARAGYPNGQGFPQLTLLLVDDQARKLLGEFLQAEWKKHLGINIRLEFVDPRTFGSRVNASDFQLVVAGWQEDYPDPENWFLGLWETGGSINKTNVSIRALDELIARAKFNTNDEERRKLYRDAEKLLLQEANGIAPLWHTLGAFLVKPHVSGMVENQRPGDNFAPGDWYIELWRTSKR